MVFLHPKIARIVRSNINCYTMSKKSLIVFVLLLATIKSYCQRTDEYQVYALKVEDSGYTTAKEIAVGAAASDSVHGCYMFWLLKGADGRNILVDTGYLDSANVASSSYVRPDLLLKRMNISASEISDVIITHCHHDHVGGIGLFPKAKFWIQKAEYGYFVGEAWQEKGFSRGFNRTDIHNLVDINLQGRLKMVDGDSIEIIPGIRVFTGSSHTKGSQYLLVNSGNPTGKVLLASDASWFYYNLNHLLPIPAYTFDPVAYVAAMKRIKTLMPDASYIIPGHDDLVFTKFPKVCEGVVRIDR